MNRAKVPLKVTILNLFKWEGEGEGALTVFLELYEAISDSE